MNIIFGYLFTYLYLILVLILTNFSKKIFHLKEEASRKIVHIMVGFSWFIMVYFFKTSIHLVIPPLTFIFINYLSYKKNIFKSMERKEKKSKGTIYYALSFTILALITYLKPTFLPFYGIGVLTMALGDGIAPFIGLKLNLEIGNTKKTYSGSLGIFLMAIIISVVFNNYYSLGFTGLNYLLIGLFASFLELFGFQYDNLTLPIGLAILSSLF